MFDNPRVRGLYSSLSDGWTYVNAQSRPQVPERVSSAVSRSFRTAPLLEQAETVSGTHSRAHMVGRRIGDGFVQSARIAIADLVGGRPECVILGASRAALMGHLSTAMSRQLSLGREIVLTRVDSPANIEPWQRAADLYGARVRWAEPELATGVLPTWQFAELVNPDTAVVAVAAANEFVGTATNVRAIADTVHAKSRGLVVVDVNAAAPYHVLDIDMMGADVMAVDLGSLGGPSVGALIFRDESIFETVLPRSVMNSAAQSRAYRESVTVPPVVARARAVLELGGLPEGLLGGVPAAVDHLASLDDEARGTRRRRLEKAVPQATAYMNGLAKHLVEGLQDLGVVHVIGVDGDFDDTPASFDAVPRIPRVSFMVEGVSAATVQDRLLGNGLVPSVADRGESMLLERMGVFEEAASGAHARRAKTPAAATNAGPGAVVIGLSPHNTVGDMEQIIRVVASLR
ncbi:aminotransferase class V-fold PLP-dependent enzyme [Corynebacterium sp. DSM 45110]|uniref:Aminotransferase class V-fold PLP-dependent enzyme n=1 Tax=Corynebacterium suicordis DSM 45110 TaxID=1121369 RepID=A0ABR9ZGT8_9CORY|nr:aminotransferase class V-fold PLP-dependent enzyme [Corynebacterium suicordis DSM 45110]